MTKPKIKTWVVLTDNVLNSCLDVLRRTPVDGKWMITVQETKHRRTLAQNALYRMWVKDIADQRGYNTDRIADGLRMAYLAPIILKEPHGHRQQQWAEMFVAIGVLMRKLPPEEGTKAMERIKKAASTAWVTTTQFTEYLECIEKYCYEHQLSIRHPDDYDIAMGKRKIAS